MITTNDSRIRFVNATSGEQLLKMKGHKNEYYMVKAGLSPCRQYALCASEDGAVYIWSHIETKAIEQSKKGLLSKLVSSTKVAECEYFVCNQQQDYQISGSSS